MKIGEFNHVAPQKGKSYLSDIPADKRNAHEVRADRFSNWLILNHTGEDLWTAAATQILWAVTCALTVTRLEMNYLQEHIGYAWHEVLTLHTYKEMSKMVVAQLWLQISPKGHQLPGGAGQHPQYLESSEGGQRTSCGTSLSQP
jgi:hypothetical protein